MKKGGHLYVSGFYGADLPLIKECCEGLGLRFEGNKLKNQWVAAKFVY